MRQVSIVFTLLVSLLSACNRQVIDAYPSSDEKGFVAVNLSASDRSDFISVKSGTESVLPEKGDFWIEFINSGKVKFFKEKYSDVEGQSFGMNIGDFTLVARHGDSLGVGFDKPFYMAKVPFSVEPQKTTVVEAVAKLANVKVAVTYNEAMQTGYSDYYAIVEHVDHTGKSLVFQKDETRAGYIPAGRLSITVYAYDNGVLKCFTPKDHNGNPMIFTYSPNDFVTFNLRADEKMGRLYFDIKIDDEVELVEQSIEVPADAVSDLAPSIVLSSCDDEGVYYITEGVTGAPSDLGFTYKAYAGLRRCELAVELAVTKAVSIPQVIDLLNMDEATRTQLESMGFFFAEAANVGVVGIEDFVYEYSKNAVYLGGGKPTEIGQFTLTVEDVDGSIISKTLKVQVKPDGAASISLNDYDVWATKVVNPKVAVSKGNHALMKVQSSTDNVQWNDFMQITSANFSMGTVTGLNPSTKYYLRVIYDDWIVVSDVIELTTEAAVQVGNAGFESYQTVQTDFTPAGGALGGGTYTRTWYQPYASNDSNPWWACNSLQSMPDGHTGWTSTWCKNFPSSGYVTDSHSGSKAALLYCVNVGGTNTDNSAVGTTYEGELWIGTADGSGNHATEGHAFTSRPGKLTFWYKYSPNSSNKFFVDSWIKAADGTVIATAQETAGPAASSWTKHSLTYNYSATNKKAAQIYIRISSCYGDGNVSTKTSFTLGTGSVTAHAGSFLKIDDIELVYE